MIAVPKSAASSVPIIRLSHLLLAVSDNAIFMSVAATILSVSVPASTDYSKENDSLKGARDATTSSMVSREDATP